ncbi:MAG: ATP synthase F1 subunit delta [Amoebophilaceae bacterium]|nr:ATP synthase F1 subunit delta [Amoebophilaceae bacterium]
MVTNRKLVARYASVFLSYAIADNQLEEVKAGVSFLQHTFNLHSSLEKVLCNPTILPAEKEKLLETLCKHKITPFLWKFIVCIIKQHQVEQLKAIATCFMDDYQVYMKVCHALLTTAVPLPGTLAAVFIDKVKQLGDYKEVVLEQRVDTAIIGGYILQIGMLKVDRSIKNQLYLLQNSFQ